VGKVGTHLKKYLKSTIFLIFMQKMENTLMRNMNGALFEHGNIGTLNARIDFCNGILKKTMKLKKKSIA
jgi:hypothetical protein